MASNNGKLALQLIAVAASKGYTLSLWYDEQWKANRWRMTRADGGVSFLSADDNVKSVVDYFRECGWVR